MTNDFAGDDRPALSPATAFVVHVASGTDTNAGQVVGRVEHVLSGANSRFRSTAELLGFIDRVLAHTSAVKSNGDQ